MAVKFFGTRKTRDDAAGLHFKLREFVYLDRVSLYSLLASLVGKVDHEESETVADETGDGVEANVGSNVGVARASAKASQSRKRETRTTVVRRSFVQSAFKDLVDNVEKSASNAGSKFNLVGSPSDGAPHVESKRAQSALAAGDLRSPDLPSGLAYSAAELTRGRMVFLASELRAEQFYAVRALVATMVDILGPRGIPMPPNTPFGDAGDIRVFLDELLAGLVPMRCRLRDYRAVEINGERFLVHNLAQEVLTGANVSFESRPCDLVAVAESRYFWQDVRRVLFDSREYMVAGRVQGKGLEESWEPIKVAHVFDEYLPEVSRLLREAVEGFGKSDKPDHKQTVSRDRHRAFAEQFALRVGRDPTTVPDQFLAQLRDDSREPAGRIAWERRAERQIASLILNRELEDGDLGVIRAVRAGLSAPEEAAPAGERRDEPIDAPVVLEVEPIAIYW